MIVTIPQVSKEQVVDFLQTAAKFSAIGGTVVSVAFAILGHDYTYPCTIALLGVGTWFSIWTAQSAKNEDLNRKNMSAREIVQEKLDNSIDALGVSVKDKLKHGKNTFVDINVTLAKTAVLTSLPTGIGSSANIVVGPSLDLVGSSAKGISDKSIDSSVDLMGRGVKKSTSGSLGVLFSGSKE